ncbi:MAG: AraC family transcriptional regulator [Bacteroidota bacterium]
MITDYTNIIYDHFSKRVTRDTYQLNKGQNYLMRLATPLSHYAYENNNLTIIYFKDGAGELQRKNRRVKIDQDKFVVTNPSLGWEYINSKAKPIDVLFIVICESLRGQFHYFKSTSAMQQLDDPFDQANIESFFLEDPLGAAHYKSGQLLQHIHQFSSQSAFHLTNPEELSMNVLESIYQDQHQRYILAKRVQAKKPSTQLETFKRLLVAYEYIHDNINNPISLEELAKVSSLSKFHLYDSFKNVYGQTPHQYINRHKVTKAKEYIEQGESSIGEVADLFGFNDIAVFSKLFKKIYGNPPSHYQN